MSGEIVMTKERIIAYIRKYWWIVIISFLLGLFCFFLSINNNGNQIQEHVSYEQNIIPVILEDEKPTSITLVRGNCRQLISLEETQEEINDCILSQGGTSISDWSTIEIVNVDDSLIFALSIEQDDIEVAEKQADAIISVLNSKLLQYEQNVELNPIDKLQESKMIIGDEQNVYLKDVLLLFGFFAAGLIIVYLFALFGNVVCDVADVEQILDRSALLSVNKKNFSLMGEWLTSLDQQETTIFLLGNETENVSNEILSQNNKNFIVVPWEQCGEQMRKNPVSKKYLVVHYMKDRISDIEKTEKISKLNDVDLDGWIFVKV